MGVSMNYFLWDQHEMKAEAILRYVASVRDGLKNKKEAVTETQASLPNLLCVFWLPLIWCSIAIANYDECEVFLPYWLPGLGITSTRYRNFRSTFNLKSRYR